MSKIKKGMLTLLAAVTLLGLAGCKPAHKVYGTEVLKVYEVSETEGSMQDKHGKYRYSITDGSGMGWQLVTDSEFNLGDRLEITVKEAK